MATERVHEGVQRKRMCVVEVAYRPDVKQTWWKSTGVYTHIWDVQGQRITCVADDNVSGSADHTG
eukprot:1598761-Heterocapsa_arctica.AAC.1